MTDEKLLLTWDTNCIITLECSEERRAADKSALQEMLALHDSGRLEIQIPAPMASETQEDGPYITNFEEHQDRLSAAGLGHLGTLPAPLVFGMAFFGQTVFADGRLQQIFSIMFPSASFDAIREGESKTNWWGRRVDAAVYWSHINSGRDLFVTSDQKGFIRNGRREALIDIGGRGIESPVEAIKWVHGELGAGFDTQMGE